MDYSELVEIVSDEKEICIFGAGILGKGDGYLFLKNMLENPNRIKCFCDNHIPGG